MEEHHRNLLLRMLVVITDKTAEKKVEHIMDEFRVPMRYEFFGKGTAGSEFLEICGLNETGRVIVIGLIQRKRGKSIYESLERELKISEKGKGIAFTIPVNGIQSYLLKKLDESQQKALEELNETAERIEQDMKDEITYAMILVACSQGYSGEVMDAAREAGATGGTIMKSRRQGLEDPMKFWGVAIQEEQEVVSIIVSKDIKRSVMEGISEKCGCHTPAKGLILSVPVDEIIGLV